MVSSRPDSSAHTFLSVKNLTKRYGKLTALDDVSFSIRHGEVLGLIGPNGSGKTTLFECLGGVLPSDGGTVHQDGRTLDAKRRSSQIFYLPDAIAPWGAQPLRWALDFTLGFFGGAVDLRDAVVRALHLDSLLHSPIGTLSKGQRKRALLGIGLLTPQPVLLADEPFDGLDLRQSREVAGTLRSFAALGRTMFLSIHQINQAARVCDRFVLLSGGRVCGEGALDDLSAVAASRNPNVMAGDLEEVFLALT